MKSLTAIVSRPMPRRLFAMLAVSLCTLGSASAQEFKIGFVRVDRISESVPYKAANAKLEAEFSKREKDVRDLDARLKAMAEKFDKDLPVLSESERVKRQRELVEMDKDVQRKKREVNEDFAQRRNEDNAAILERARKVIVQIAEKEKYDLIVTDAVYAGPRVDITDKLMAILNK